MAPVTNSERRPFDTSLQGLAALYSQHLLTWLKGPQMTWLQELNSVIVAQQRRADFLIRYHDGVSEKLLHVEFQTLTQPSKPQEELPARMAIYALLVYNRYGLMPEQVLILLKDTAASRRVPNVFAQGRVRVEYDVVRLWEVDAAAVLASRLVGLMPLVPLMAGQSLQERLEQCSEVIQAEVQSEQERNEVLTVTGLLASLIDTAAVVQFFRARSIMSLLTETPLFQELTKQAVQAAERRMLLGLLTERFGPLPETLIERIEAIQEASRLEELAKAVLRTPDLQNFEQLL